MWFQKNKWKILVPVLIAAALTGAFFLGGSAPDGQPSAPVTPAVTAAAPESGKPAPAAPEAPEETAEPAPEAPEATAEPEAASAPAPEQDAYLTDPVPEGKPLPVEPQAAEIREEALKCTISISCAAILNNMELCDEAKRELIPADGWILCPLEVTFYEGESVFNVLQRVCKQQKIHMEFENTPLYNSAYIEGIYNLYEFDVGELSGWMYKVNDWFPNYGCSRYQLRDGDVICWVYTCDLGYDVGGGYAVGE